MTDEQSLLALKQTLHKLLLAVSGLPTARLDNLAEWDAAVPPIVEAAEMASMALRERNPNVASILLVEVAAKCAAMREVLKREDEGEHPPIPVIVQHREVQISEIQAAIARALRELED